MHPLTDCNLLQQRAGNGLLTNAPMGPQRRRDLVASVAGANPATVIDIGCGRATLLLRCVDLMPALQGIGVDRDVTAITIAQQQAHQFGVADRVLLTVGDARAEIARHRANVTICIGASHAVGGLASLLDGAASPMLLLGEAFWVTGIDQRWRRDFGRLPEGLPGLTAACRAAGWVVESAAASDQWEWDDFERRWCAAARASNLPGGHAFAQQRWAGYRRGYRGLLGFGWLRLRRRR